MPANRDKAGRFVKGKSGNPAGRPPVPDSIKTYGRQAPKKLRAIADDPDTPVKVKADIEKWFAEMAFGKASQQVALEGDVNTNTVTVVKFEGDLEKWSK